MKTFKMVLFIVGIFGFYLTAISQGTQLNVKDILDNPGKFSDNVVKVEGVVEQYVEGTATTTSYYILKGKYGNPIKVNTAEAPPEINETYLVTGIVYIDPVTQEPFISEKTKLKISSNPPPPPDRKIPYGLLALLSLLVILLISLFVYQKRLKKPQPEPEPEPSPMPNPIVDDKKTIIIKPAPKTVKFIPGEFHILTGADKGKHFRIAGFPENNGSIVTIGRKEVKGDRAYAHIQLGQEYPTVSREQAEFIFKDNKLYIKNLSTTNYTHVDGIELMPGEVAELKNNSLIRMGELELKYMM